MTFRRWLQFRLRTIFVAVAVAAIACAYYRNYRDCMDRAEQHQAKESDWSASFKRESDYIKVYPDDPEPWFVGVCRENMNRQKRLRQEYENAAVLPWARFWIDE